MIGWVYRFTHRNVSYSQSYVQTLVILGMLISLIMLVVGSNIARAFALVGALSVVRFRNAIKETRDVGFIFLVMGVGMAAGTRFYTLAIVAAVAICLVIVVMYRFNWFAAQRAAAGRQGPGAAGRRLHRTTSRTCSSAHTSEFELVSMESIRGGALTELMYTVRLKKGQRARRADRGARRAHRRAAGDGADRLRPDGPVMPRTDAVRCAHRIPVRVRHYWKLLAACAAFLVVVRGGVQHRAGARRW